MTFIDEIPQFSNFKLYKERGGGVYKIKISYKIYASCCKSNNISKTYSRFEYIFLFFNGCFFDLAVKDIIVITSFSKSRVIISSSEQYYFVAL